MTTLVLGATGNTGRHLVKQLLDREHYVKVIVRSPEKLPEAIKHNDRLRVIHASVLDLSDADMQEHVKGCDAVASCLGHTLSFKGVFGPPHRLVTDAARRMCEAIKGNEPVTPVKFVLMNTTGNQNRDLDEPRSFGEKIVVGLLRLLIPPHADNEQAADYLRTQVGSNNDQIEWAAVRPDTLIDEDEVTPYDTYQSPTRSAIFNAGKTSRINVAHFMAELIHDEATWNQWKGQMPVIYNKEET